MDLEQELLQEGVSRAILAEAAAFRKAHPAGNMQKRIPTPRFLYYGKEVWEEAAAALLQPDGGKITATLGSDMDPPMPGACIVSKRYLAGGGLTGAVALIGSTRMEYRRLLPVLNYFALKLGQCMAGQGQ